MIVDESSVKMEKIIISKLKEIEEKEKVKIILAVESGSRAWGFESIDSDYDVRFIYIRPIEDYLKLEPIRDVIEWQLDDVLDINGWDIKKTLKLLYKSNPTVFEWLESSIIYSEKEEAKVLRALSKKYYDKKKLLYHYWHMAKMHYDNYLKEENVKLKKYFYALRPLLAASYIIKNDKPALINFDDLVEEELPKSLKPYVSELLKMKKSTKEIDNVKQIPELNKYIEEQLEYFKNKADELSVNEKNWDELNEMFINLVKN